MKPKQPRTLRQQQCIDGIRIVGYWAVLYLIALAVILMDCIVWRP